MANKTVYPFGTGGPLPSSIGIINDLTTGGANKALSAEQGKLLGDYVFGDESSESNLEHIIQYDGKSINKSTGELINASSTGANVKVFKIAGYNSVFASGYAPSDSGSSCAIGYYADDYSYIGYQQLSESSSKFTNRKLDIPENAKYAYIFGVATSPNTALALIAGVERTVSIMSDNYDDEKEVPACNTYNHVYIDKNDGALVSSVSVSSVVNEYYMESGDAFFFADGRCGANTASCIVAYYDSEYNYLGYEYGSTGQAENKMHTLLTPPDSATIIRVFGTRENIEIPVIPPKLYIRKRRELVISPQVFNFPTKTKSTGDTLRLLLFGSSWFECTWWYLNSLIKSAGINAEIHAYYMGHSQMREWIELFNNDLTPFSGSEATRGASRNVAINADSWTTKTYRSSYTAQQYRDDFYADLTSGDWDIIAFQQGASQSPHWHTFWKPYYSELVRIIKQNCAPNTIMAFNSTWAPAIGSTKWMLPWPATADGQRLFQLANWDATKRFLAASGIYNISPCGKTLWNLRQSELNDQNDLAGDGVHPSNGLPIYALGLTFFQTYISPMYGIDGDAINWMPTSSTAKAPVSGSYYVSMSENQRALVRQLVKKALGNRFEFD